MPEATVGNAPYAAIPATGIARHSAAFDVPELVRNESAQRSWLVFAYRLVGPDRTG